MPKINLNIERDLRKQHKVCECKLGTQLSLLRREWDMIYIVRI